MQYRKCLKFPARALLSRLALLITLLAAAPAGLGAGAQELTFENALTLALEGPAVQLAARQLEMAAQRLELAASPLSLQLSGGYTRGSSTLELPDGTQTAEKLSDWSPLELRATFNVLPLGPRFDQLQQADIAFKRAQGSYRTARADALVSTVREYLAAVRSTQEISLRELASSEAELRLGGVTVQQQAGAASAAQLLEAELALDQARSDAATARQTLAGDLASLSARLGVPVSGVAGAAPQGPLPAALLGVDPAERIPERDDVRQAQFSLKETRISTAATRREQLPQGSLSLGYQSATDSTTVQLGASLDTRSWQPGLSVSVDPDSGVANLPPGASTSSSSVSVRVDIPLDVRLSTALELADLTLHSAEEQLQQAVTLARSDIASAHLNLAGADAASKLAGQLAAQAEATLKAAQERHALGLISPVELLGAERRAAESLLRQGRAADSVLLARLALAAALALNPLEAL